VRLCIARDPGVRLRDIAARTRVTERTAYGIVTDLTEAGYVVKHEDGRRNRCQIQAHLPLPETDSRNAPSARSWPCWPAPTMKRPDNPGRLDRGTAPSAPAPGHARHCHHPAVRRRDAIAEGANRVRPADAAGPGVADPHARIVHSSGEPVRPASHSRRARAASPFSGPSSQAARLTCGPETLR